MFKADIPMPPLLLAYATLALAILSEVTGSSLLQKSEQFTRFGPTLAMAAFYAMSFYLLAQSLRALPLGIAYAIWCAAGMVLTALIGLIFFKQALDLWAFVGIALIIAGVLVISLLSKTVSH